MLSGEQLSGFLAAAVLITVAPGPDNLMVLSMGAAHGRLRGIAFGLGCAIGCLLHTLLAILGVSALVAASPLAFQMLKAAGALYLLWLGIGALRAGGAARIDTLHGSPSPLGRLFLQGMLANAINPKVILFFLAFLPQFVVAAHGDPAAQMAFLGSVFTLQAALLFGLLGFFAGAAAHWMARTPRASLWLNRIAGIVLIVLALRLVVFT
jgi:threonine/homoserine/homoserine lactone efflux protein